MLFVLLTSCWFILFRTSFTFPSGNLWYARWPVSRGGLTDLGEKKVVDFISSSKVDRLNLTRLVVVSSNLFLYFPGYGDLYYYSMTISRRVGSLFRRLSWMWTWLASTFISFCFKVVMQEFYYYCYKTPNRLPACFFRLADILIDSLLLDGVILTNSLTYLPWI